MSPHFRVQLHPWISHSHHTRSSAPPNCRFECDDVNLGLAHYKGCFDVVNARCISTGITDFRKLVDEIADVLRPGGVFLSIDGDMELFDENFRPITAQNESERVRPFLSLFSRGH